jgi:hypothetical protein
MGGNPDQVEFKMNTDFFDSTMTPQEVMSMIQLADRGSIAETDIRSKLRSVGWIDADRTDDDIDAESEISGAGLLLPDNSNLPAIKEENDASKNNTEKLIREAIKPLEDKISSLSLTKTSETSLPDYEKEFDRIESSIADLSALVANKDQSSPTVINPPVINIPAPVVNVTIERGGVVKKEMSITSPSGEIYTGTINSQIDEQ